MGWLCFNNIQVVMYSYLSFSYIYIYILQKNYNPNLIVHLLWNPIPTKKKKKKKQYLGLLFCQIAFFFLSNVRYQNFPQLLITRLDYNIKIYTQPFKLTQLAMLISTQNLLPNLQKFAMPPKNNTFLIEKAERPTTIPMNLSKESKTLFQSFLLSTFL